MLANKSIRYPVHGTLFLLLTVLALLLPAAASQAETLSNRVDSQGLEQLNASFDEAIDALGVLDEELATAEERHGALFDRAGSQGVVPVIVRLKTALQSESTLDVAAVQAQREALANAQQQVLDRLSATAVQDEAELGVKRFMMTPAFAMQADQAALQELLDDPDVLDVVEDRALPPALMQSVPLIGGVNGAFNGKTGLGQTIAILDTGVEGAHVFLTGKVVSEACYSSNVASDGATSLCPGGVTASTATGSGKDCSTSIAGCGHGTHVAGIAAGKGTSFSGVARDAKLIAIKVFSQFTGINCTYAGYASPCAFAYTSDIIKGLERVYALRGQFAIASVNMSLGGGRYTSACDFDPTKPIIDSLRSAGIATVIASGNSSYTNAISAPACISSAVSVGCTDKSDNVCSFSNSASFLGLLAPGYSIYSSILGTGNNQFGYKSGTSMAAPHVAGAWAVLKSAQPAISVTDALNALKTTGEPVTDYRNGITKPRIQLDAAVVAIGGSTQKAVMTSPAPGSTLAGSSQTFVWTNVGAAQYYLYVGTTSGGKDLYAQSQGTNTSVTVSGLPTDGRTLYVRLWTLQGTTWSSNDYSYTAATSVAQKAVMTSPAPGSTLAGSSQTFVWTNVGAAQYYLYVGTTSGGKDLYAQSQGTNTSVTVSGLPTDGRTLYVRLWTLQGTTWASNDYSYTAATSVSQKAVMTSPAPGSTLAGSSQTFVWTNVGAAQYYLYVGTTSGGKDLYAQSQGTNTSVTVSGLPTDGRTLYVRLWTLQGTTWASNDYSYTAATSVSQKAVMTSPAPGSTLAGSSQTFVWTNVGAAQYYLYVGTTSGGKDLYAQSQGTNTSVTVSGLPTDGRALYVRLWTLQGTTWAYNDYSYTAATSVAQKAVMLYPVSGSILDGSDQFFWWTDVGAAQYYLYVGTTAGGKDLYAVSQGTNTWVNVPGLPTDGRTLYVRLWTLQGATWSFNDYSYTTPNSAVMTSPAPGSTLAGSTQTFTWTDVGATEYQLYVADDVGSAFYLGSYGTNTTSATVSGLPVDGRPLYVVLWTIQGSSWSTNAYWYTAATDLRTAAMTSPARGSTLAGSTQTFTWTNAGATEYYLDISDDSGSLYSQSQGTNTSVTVSGLPTNGLPLYVALWTLRGTTWSYNLYRYTAAGEIPTAAMISPAPGSTLAGSTQTFTWTDVGATEYDLDIWNDSGWSYYGSQGTNTSATVSGLPTDGRPVYVDLWTIHGTIPVYEQYEYTAAR